MDAGVEAGASMMSSTGGADMAGSDAGASGTTPDAVSVARGAGGDPRMIVVCPSER